MFAKLIAAVLVTFVAAFFSETRSYAVPVFFIAVVAAFVVEAVRIVPQQRAVVVERLGRFHAVLEPGLRVYKIHSGYWFFGRPTVEELRLDLRAVLRRCRPDWGI